MFERSANESIVCQIGAHGERELEIKVHYPLERKARRPAYQLDLCLFSPYSLGISRDRYGPDRFLRDLRCHTRATVPRLSFAEILDPASEISPLARLQRLLAGEALLTDAGEWAAIHEMKMLAVIVARAATAAVAEALNAPTETANAHTESFLRDACATLDRLRAMRPAFQRPSAGKRIRTAFDLADECLGISVEKEALLLRQALADRQNLAAATSAALLRLAGLEMGYRRTRGYPAVAQSGDWLQNEQFVARNSDLKKWAESALYMSAAPANWTGRIAQALFGLAAGAAMAFAVAAAILANRWFPAESIPWAILIVISYILKDRIKEWLRGGFLRILPKMISDRMRDLIDPKTGRWVGRTREWVEFPAPSAVPAWASPLAAGEFNALRREIPPDDVARYQKDIRIQAARLRRAHSRMNSITEILRLSLDAWRERMDDPCERLRFVEEGRVCEEIANRVYPIGLALRFSEKRQGGRHLIRRGTLFVTRDRIARIVIEPTPEGGIAGGGAAR